MKTCPSFQHLLVLPRLRIQNANAISSPLTHGFPSITAFLGLMWALQRKTSNAGLDLVFKAIGVVCHDYQEQVSNHFGVNIFCLTRSPLKEDGEPEAIIEEGRIHLEVSLTFAVTSNRWQQDPATRDDDMETVARLMTQMRVAGGTVLPPRHPEHPRHQPWALDLTGTDDDRQSVFTKARARLLPGFALVSRPDLLETRYAEFKMEHPATTRLDAWLWLSRRQWRYHPDDKGKKGHWRMEDRKGQGWIVPIPVGYGALDSLHAPGQVANARDTTIPFCFVENLYSIGQWVSPHRLHLPEQLLWYAQTRPREGAYLCRNDYDLNQNGSESDDDEEFD